VKKKQTVLHRGDLGITEVNGTIEISLVRVLQGHQRALWSCWESHALVNQACILLFFLSAPYTCGLCQGTWPSLQNGLKPQSKHRTLLTQDYSSDLTLALIKAT
jgi:hypothetical protein